MAGFSDELKSRLPELALSIMAGLQGPQALGAFQGGVSQARERSQELARQAQMDEERRAQQAAIEARARRDDDRLAEQQQMQKLQAALGVMDRFSAGVGETATDPVAAENQVLSRGAGLETAFGLPQGQLSSFVPNMGPIVSAKDKRAAKEFVDSLPKNPYYAGYFQTPEGIAELENTTLTEWRGKPNIKIGQIRAMADDAQLPIRPATAKPDVPNTPEEQFYATFATEHNTTWEKLPRALKAQARKEWMQSDDRPTQGADPEIAELRKDLLRMQVERAGEPKEANQAQFTAATYAGRMEQAERTFGTVAPAITAMGLPSFELQTNSWFAKPTFQSADVQSYMQAARNFINAVLRRESGAVISPSEFAEARQQYLPQPGDTDAVLAQKKANRDYVFSGMKRAAGSAYEPPLMPSSPRTDGAGTTTPPPGGNPFRR